MPIKDSESHELIQIEMAAKGHVSGTLAEWPHLKHALRKRGINLPDTANAQEMRDACCGWLRKELTRLDPAFKEDVFSYGSW